MDLSDSISEGGRDRREPVACQPCRCRPRVFEVGVISLWELRPQNSRLATVFLTLLGKRQASSKRWQPGDSEHAFQFALRGLVPELLGLKSLENVNSKEVVACFLEGHSIPQRNYRKVKRAFIKRLLFVLLSFIRLSVFLILNSLQQPSFSLPLPFFFLTLSIYRQSKIFGQHTQGGGRKSEGRNKKVRVVKKWGNKSAGL